MRGGTEEWYKASKAISSNPFAAATLCAAAHDVLALDAEVADQERRERGATACMRGRSVGKVEGGESGTDYGARQEKGERTSSDTDDKDVLEREDVGVDDARLEVLG